MLELEHELLFGSWLCGSVDGYPWIESKSKETQNRIRQDEFHGKIMYMYHKRARIMIGDGSKGSKGLID